MVYASHFQNKSSCQNINMLLEMGGLGSIVSSTLHLTGSNSEPGAFAVRPYEGVRKLFCQFQMATFSPSQLPHVFALFLSCPQEDLSLLSLTKWLCLSDIRFAYAIWCQIMQLFVTHERTTKCCVCISPSEGVQFWAKGFCCPLLCGARKVFCQFQLSPRPILPLNFVHGRLDSFCLSLSQSTASCLLHDSASMLHSNKSSYLLHNYILRMNFE